MQHPAPPPLPQAPPLTAEAAARWRSARTAHRWELRRLAFVPLALMLLLAVGPHGPELPDAPHWYASADAVLAALLLQALALTARPGRLPLLPYALLAVLGYAPGAAPDGPFHRIPLLAEAALAALLTVAAVGRHRARRRLAALLGPEVPYPWTLAGQPSPFLQDPDPPVGRQCSGALLLAAAAVLQLTFPALLVVSAGLAGTGLVALASAAEAVRLRRSLADRPGAPALRVDLQEEYVPQVGAVGGEPLWELSFQEWRHWQDGRWQVRAAPEAADGPDDEDDEDDDEDCGCGDQLPGPPRPALLYQGPDGRRAQLLVHSWPTPDGTAWVAALTRPEVRPGGSWSD
ncbi:hypothetical protein ACIRBX_29395 [Kitasatospora sp. NPDC096147]|uniref:hypothetical protein n=1 Tax=Kitasatospora sp. NPDC096147 TaxID=3364093 RepID=UPI00380A3CC5